MGQCDRDKCLVCNPPWLRRNFAIERERLKRYRRACTDPRNPEPATRIPPLPPIPDEE